jgi:large subunit ribosomal protein L35
MPKMKSKRSAAKRFSFTGTGKVKRAAAYHRHNMTGKPQAAKVSQRRPRYLEPGDAALVKLMLPYG